MRQAAGDASGAPERPLEGKTAVILGTGGAARALAFGAAQRGADVVIAGRAASKVAALAEQVDKSCQCSVQACAIADVQEGKLPAVDVVLNTTPLGMAGEREGETPLPQAALEQVRAR
jgi:shikimate 5-dehydrogenase